MLSLKTTSSLRWLDQAAANLPELLIDHAHCEKKAAGTAMNLLFAYVENVDLCRAMTEIVQDLLGSNTVGEWQSSVSLNSPEFAPVIDFNRHSGQLFDHEFTG